MIISERNKGATEVSGDKLKDHSDEETAYKDMTADKWRYQKISTGQGGQTKSKATKGQKK